MLRNGDDGNFNRVYSSNSGGFNRIYGGATPESNTMHVVFNGTAAVTIDAATLTGLEVIDPSERAAAAAMAFDEPLTKAEVIEIVRPFIKDDAARGLP